MYKLIKCIPAPPGNFVTRIRDDGSLRSRPAKFWCVWQLLDNAGQTIGILSEPSTTLYRKRPESRQRGFHDFTIEVMPNSLFN